MTPIRNTIVITPPASEPVSVDELLTQLRLVRPLDADAASELEGQLSSLIASARTDCEDVMRRVLVLQTRELQMNHFPHGGDREHRHHPHEISLPYPRLLAVESVTWVDLTGALQTMPCDYTFGSDPNLPPYCYQIAKGTETLPGRISPARFRCWPPAMHAEGSVKVRYRCGYGGNITVSVGAASAAVTSSFGFLPDDIGTPISIAGAGADANTALVTSIATVDAEGNATLATPATTAAEGAAAYFGYPVPEPIRQCILIVAQTYYEEGFDQDMPQFVLARLLLYRNSSR